jgi:hypothetical protein
VPTKSPGTALGKPSESTSHLIPADYLHPTYVNMYDLANMAASKAAEMKGGGQNATGESGSAPHPTTEHKVSAC